MRSKLFSYCKKEYAYIKYKKRKEFKINSKNPCWIRSKILNYCKKQYAYIKYIKLKEYKSNKINISLY